MCWQQSSAGEVVLHLVLIEPGGRGGGGGGARATQVVSGGGVVAPVGRPRRPTLDTFRTHDVRRRRAQLVPRLHVRCRS